MDAQGHNGCIDSNQILYRFEFLSRCCNILETVPYPNCSSGFGRGGSGKFGFSHWL